jgi:DNA repair exonuclease SbcCD nuclease subunit
MVYPIKPITIVPGVDLVIVAGDVCEGMLRAFEHLRRIVPMDIPILMVPGNHEFYRKFIPDDLALAFAHAGAFNLHLLSDTAVALHSLGGK